MRAGLEDFDVTTWTVFFVPPRDIVDKLVEVTHAGKARSNRAHFMWTETQWIETHLPLN